MNHLLVFFLQGVVFWEDQVGSGGLLKPLPYNHSKATSAQGLWFWEHISPHNPCTSQHDYLREEHLCQFIISKIKTKLLVEKIQGMLHTWGIFLATWLFKPIISYFYQSSYFTQRQNYKIVKKVLVIWIF